MSFKKCLPVILAGVGGVGVVATAIAAAKNTTKYNKMAEEEKDFKSFVKCYWPTILLGTGTIASIATGTIIGKKTEASLTAALSAVGAGYNKYQAKVKQKLGLDTHKGILADIAKDECAGMPAEKNGKILYWNQYIGKFYAKPEDVNKAIINMNMRLCSNPVTAILPQNEYWRTTIRDFVLDANAEVLDKNIYDAWKDYGWSTEYLSDIMEDIWIYDGFCYDVIDGVNVRILSFDTADPILNPKDWDHNEYVTKNSEYWHGTNVKEIQEGQEEADAEREAPNED